MILLFGLNINVIYKFFIIIILINLIKVYSWHQKLFEPYSIQFSWHMVYETFHWDHVHLNLDLKLLIQEHTPLDI